MLSIEWAEGGAEREQDHRSAVVVKTLPEPPIEDLGLTEFVQVLPERYKVPGDAVAAYRKFYLGEKIATARWTGRPVPEWLSAGLSTSALP